MRWSVMSMMVVGLVCGCVHKPAVPNELARTWNVRWTGAVGDGRTKDTAAFQDAINACSRSGGGEVVVPAGNYVIGSVLLKSKTTLKLEKGATLVGSPDLNDYPIVDVRWEGRWVKGHRALIAGDHASEIAVVGPGKIAAAEGLGGREMPRRPVLIEPIECRGVRLEGFSTQHQSMWSIHPTCCMDVHIRNLVIRSSGANGDGIDVDSCRVVRIEGCDIDTGDDCIAIKSGRGMEGFREARPSQNVWISNCTLGDSGFACVAIGSEISGGVRDVRVEHCRFAHARTFAIYIKSRTGRGGGIENVLCDDLDVGDTRGFLHIDLLNSGRKDPEPVAGMAGIPIARNLRFSNVRMEKGAAVEAVAIDPSEPIQGLSISNLSGKCEKGISLAHMRGVELRRINLEVASGPKLMTRDVTGTGLEGAVPLGGSVRGATAPSVR